MVTSAKDRMAAVRDRRKALGLRQVLVWVPADHVEEVRSFASKLCARFEASQAAKAAPAARTVPRKASSRPVRPPQAPPERSSEEIFAKRVAEAVKSLEKDYETIFSNSRSIKGARRGAEHNLSQHCDAKGWPRDVILAAKKRLNWP